MSGTHFTTSRLPVIPVVMDSSSEGAVVDDYEGAAGGGAQWGGDYYTLCTGDCRPMSHHPVEAEWE